MKNRLHLIVFCLSLFWQAGLKSQITDSIQSQLILDAIPRIAVEMHHQQMCLGSLDTIYWDFYNINTDVFPRNFGYIVFQYNMMRKTMMHDGLYTQIEFRDMEELNDSVSLCFDFEKYIISDGCRSAIYHEGTGISVKYLWDKEIGTWTFSSLYIECSW